MYLTIRPASLPLSVRPHPSVFLGRSAGIVEDRGGGDLERKKERKWTSVSGTASFFALILSPQAARCSQARCYMATIRRAESQHLVLPNLWQLTVHTHTHTHAYTQPGGTSSITLAGHSRVNKVCSPLPDLPAAQPFHPRADTMYSLQAQKQCCLNPFKGLDPCTESRQNV